MPTIDPIRNKAHVVVAGGFDQVVTAIALAPGEAAKLPIPSVEGPFNLICHNDTDFPDPADDPAYEIMRVTGVIGDVLSPVLRAQEGTAASLHNIPGKVYKLLLAPTKASIDQIRSQYPQVFKGVMSGLTSAIQFTNVPGLKANSNVSICWGLNPITPIGALSVKEQGDDGHIIVESTADEGGVDKQVVLVLYP